jgi:hypothetical protein
MNGRDAGAQIGMRSDVIEKYEILRRAVLGEGLPRESRNGLALFLRRGMWGWVQAAAIPITPPRLARSSFTGSSVEDEHRAVVHLFAAMATRSSNRRAHERIPQGPIAPP